MSGLKVKIRYNTLSDGKSNRWRVLVNDEEHLADDIIMNVPSYTSEDVVWDSVRNDTVTKYHISCNAKEISWTGKIIVIN